MRMSLSFRSTSAASITATFHRSEAGLAGAVTVEGADAHQAVCAPLGRPQPVRVAAADGELGREDAGLGALRHVVHGNVEAPALGPPATCAEASRPSPGRRPRRLRVDAADGVGLVVLAGEQAPSSS